MTSEMAPIHMNKPYPLLEKRCLLLTMIIWFRALDLEMVNSWIFLVGFTFLFRTSKTSHTTNFSCTLQHLHMIKMSLVSIQKGDFVTDLRTFWIVIEKLFPIYVLQVLEQTYSFLYFIKLFRTCNGSYEVVYYYITGPTSFAPVIEMATSIVDKSGGQYHVLLIIADGQVLIQFKIVYHFSLIVKNDGKKMIIYKGTQKTANAQERTSH